MSFSSWIVIAALVMNVGKTQILKVPASCKGFTCENGGTLDTSRDACTCMCSENSTGLQCEIEKEDSEWPEGPYATPMPIYGCPETYGAGWRTGYINMTFTDKLTKDESLVWKTKRLTLLGPYDDHVIQMNFCYKLSHWNASNVSKPQWPPGSYGIYRAGGKCPDEFQDQTIRFELPPLLRLNTDGHVPDVRVERLNDSTLLQIDTCDRLTTSEDNINASFTEFPFILLKGSRTLNSTENCSSFYNSDSRQEMLELPVTIMRPRGKKLTKMEPGTGLRYCLYRKYIKQPDDILESAYRGMAYRFKEFNLAAVRTVRTSSAYEALYREYPVTRDSGIREKFFGKQRTLVTLIQQLRKVFRKGLVSVILKNEEIPGNFYSAKIPLSVFLESKEIPWVQVDLQEAIHVHHIILHVLRFPDRSLMWTYGDSPTLTIGNEQWSFLRNGGKSCDANLKKIWSSSLLIECSRPLIGRYVSLLGLGYGTSPAKTASFFMQLEEFEIYGKGHGCGKDLGLRDHTIEDYQITASSSTIENPPYKARPYLAGWCADDFDTDPYLQVELLVATTVEGIKLYNWETTLDSTDMDNVYGTVTFPTGLRSFWLEHGFSEVNLTVYKSPTDQKLFWMDLSLPYHHEQAFYLNTPVVASIIRVRAVGFLFVNVPATCMKLELIGCRKAKLKTMQCSRKNDTFWPSRPSLFVSPTSYYSPNVIQSTDPRYCISTCNGCDAVQYNSTSESCSLYNISESGRVISIPSAPNTILYQKTCLNDPVVPSPVTFSFHYTFYTYQEFPIELNSLIKGDGVITSFGYPLPYDTGVITKWTLLFDGVGIKPEILFTDISFNIYETSTDFPSDQLCKEDKVVLISFPFRNDFIPYSSRLWDTEYLYGDKDHALVINYTMNGRQIAYMSESFRVEIWFHACLLQSAIKWTGNGFRAIIKTTDSPTYPSSTDTYKCQLKPNVLVLSGMIVSKTFNGLTDFKNRYEYWQVCVSHKYLNLTITNLRVRCEEFSGLEVIDGAQMNKFCNLNRPMTSILSSYITLRLRFYYDKMSPDIGFQGFSSSFVSVKPSLKLGLTYGEGKYYQVGQTIFVEWRKGCISKFHRCFGLFRNTYTQLIFNGTSKPLSARSANEKCAELMGATSRLVSINSKLEAKYMLSEIIRVLRPGVARSIFGSFPQRSMYDFIYIGMVWDTDVHGTLKGRWRDGSPITFSAWAPGQPKDTAMKRCTMMGVYSWYLVNTWESIDCDAIAAEYFICETDMNNTGLYSESLHQQMTDITSITEKGLSYRYLHCRSGEIISKLFVCDGVKDCLDGTDELNCPKGDQKTECKDSSFFQCLNGDCIPISMACDFVQDCSDGSDENCVFPICSHIEFRCDNGQCIDSNYVCNYKKDCLDGSDEIKCEACQNDTYQCGDRSCIPRGRICDGYPDCTDGSDEESCEVTNTASCADWWKSGQRDTGVFIVNGTRVLCNFDLMLSKGIVKTKYYNIQAEKNARGQFELTYENHGFVKELMERLTCNQSLIQTCEPPADRIDAMESKLGLTGYQPCTCIRLIWTPNAFHAEVCTGGQDARVDEQWLRTQASKLSQYASRPLTIVEPIMSAVENRWINVEPIVCAEYVEATTGTFLCESGVAVSLDVQCLYSLNMYGDVAGCRDMTHLQHCENFTCPDGFVKCNNSYCVSESLLCDGEWHCPDGQDERYCWCGDQEKSVMVLYSDDAGLEDAGVRIAAQLYNHSNSLVSSNVELVRFTRAAEAVLGHSNRSSTEGMLIEYTPYLPRKINQFSEKKASTVTNASALIPHSLSITEDKPSALLILENSKSRAQLPTDILMDFDHTLLDQITIYAVSIGRESEFSDDVYHGAFPVQTSFVHFKTNDVTMPYAFGPEYCTELLPELSPVCPGMYRCHASRQCIAIDAVCDGCRQCPLGDDERLCDFECPLNCSCHGYEVDCSLNKASLESISSMSAKTRLLDLHSNHVEELNSQACYLPLLITLNVSSCLITDMPVLFLESMRNLLVLDMSFNKLNAIRETDFSNNVRLLTLDVTGNTQLTVLEPMTFRYLTRLRSLRIRHSHLHTLGANTFYNLKLTELDLSANRISTIEDKTFDGANIEHLDITDNPIKTFQSGIFEGISDLRALRTDAYKFCCMKPDTVKEEDCYPPRDEFSSCADLMRNEVLRFLLWIIGFCALIGNIFSLFYRLKFDRKRLHLGYGIFVTNLAVSDLLMGVYLLMIAATDVIYRGRYIEVDDWWRNSAWCGLAGVLAAMSSEASVLFMCLITLDRLIVIKYPFGNVRFSTNKALLASVISWAIVVNIATVPLWLKSYFDNQFYSRSAVCLALPLTRNRPPGWVYSTTVFIGFNFLAFLLIAVGQLLIYKEVRASSKKMKNQANRASDLAVARNLLLVVSTDFLCWFPIGVMGMMALSGHVISSEVYAWTAVLILPVNSALNPFLYTISAIIGNKAPAPKIEDKAIHKTKLCPKEMVENILDLWGAKILCQKSDRRKGYLPLSEYLTEQTVMVDEILRISLRLGQAVCQLHSLDVCHDGLSSDCVLIKRQNGTVRDVILRTSPTVASRGTEKGIDIQAFGQVIYKLLGKLEVTA